MRVSFFEPNQSVLLVGDGNFAFTVELLKLGLDLKITSSSFEKTHIYSSTLENITILKNKGVQVLVGVDATCLHKHQELNGHNFHRIVFNFPLASIKSKIHLNRELLREFFVSCSSLLASDGAVIVSLCRGQGGTTADKTPKQLSDTWQVVEMAAHGDLVLTLVEPWSTTSPLGNYTCVGRRGRDATFHREGSLVHMFTPAPSPFHDLYPACQLSKAFEPHRVNLKEGPVDCSCIESIILKRCQNIQNSLIFSYPLKHFLDYCSKKDLKTELNFMPFTSFSGMLRRTSDLESMVETLKNDLPNTLKLFCGIAFRDLNCDFSMSPVLCYTVLLGSKAFEICVEWLNNLCVHLPIEDVMVHGIKSNGVVLKMDRVAMEIFGLSHWHELWAEGVKTFEDDNKFPQWLPSSVSPPSFTFDLSVAGSEPVEELKVCRALWQLVGLLVKHIEVVDSYKSPEGWYSKCFRLTYCSYETPLYRERVVGLQKLIGEALAVHLKLTVR